MMLFLYYIRQQDYSIGKFILKFHINSNKLREKWSHLKVSFLIFKGEVCTLRIFQWISNPPLLLPNIF